MSKDDLKTDSISLVRIKDMWTSISQDSTIAELVSHTKS